ncbi:MAG: DMT family transporter [Proteobacteria bacterium]|nr:DMT family transporter [Pseudomonadota bacterium]
MQQKHKGLLWILIWCLTFTCGVSTSKFLCSSTSNFGLFCVRYLCGMFLFMPFFIKEIPKSTKPQSPLWQHLTRAACIGAASLLTYQTYRNLPLAVATSIGFTGPLLAASFGILLLKEKPTRAKIMALTLGYMGVLFIVQPTYTTLSIYVFTGLGACILAGIANTLARKLSQKDSAMTIMSTSTITLGAIALCGFFILNESINQHDLILLLLIGMFGSFSQFAYIKAVSHAEVSFVSPFEYTRLLIAVPIGYFLFAEVINYGQIFGMALIVLGSLYLSRKE